MTNYAQRLTDKDTKEIGYAVRTLFLVICINNFLQSNLVDVLTLASADDNKV